MTGHLLGALAPSRRRLLLSIRDGVIPPTINLENPDPECDLDYTATSRNKRRSASP